MCIHLLISTGYADGGETVDIADVFACSVLTEVAFVIRIFKNFGAVVREVEFCGVCEVADMVLPAELEFPA